MTENGVTQTPGGMSVDVDIDAPTQLQQSASGAAANPWLNSVPEAYRQKDWAAGLAKHEDPASEMFKQFDNQVSLIGRKAEGLKVPGEGSTPEDWNNFHKALGVPDSADKYEYKAPEVPDNLKPFFQTDESLLKSMKETFIKAGVRPEGAKQIFEAFDAYHVQELDKAVAAMNENMAKLETNFKDKFGERSNQVLQNFNNSMQGLLGKEETAVIEALDPSVKVVLAQYHEAFAKKYIREDGLNLDVPNQGQSMNQTDYGNEFERLFALVRQTQPGSSENMKAQQELKSLREKGAQIFKP